MMLMEKQIQRSTGTIIGGSGQRDDMQRLNLLALRLLDQCGCRILSYRILSNLRSAGERW